MPRYKLLIEYDGTPYVGWQAQANGRSVQQAIEEAILAFSGETLRIQGAGRTDAGVHATGQVASVMLRKDWTGDRVRDALNAHLTLSDDYVTILAAEKMPDDFDARFSARGRRYLYRVIDRRPPLALERRRAWHIRRRLDAEAMHEAAQGLLGHHDFTTFRSADCQARSAMKTLDRLDVMRVGEEIHVVAAARSFLHNQVRSMVGSLRRVGAGDWSRADLVAVLEARDRTRCAALAPPHGLYLTGVDY
ncbi:tRNA pseudouridine(38-40) synthase TruA [Labrys monachus]|uniref:tRNA pseudouridine synthase A n=1 Tax=Labrys monachus TaxID=217067 RepID=A0ABU0FAA1_9HYPH|nr:tRNA pseudouridine(38-40) synthase TruA [Labrys monachus]MDQ0391034.1 tRNA pseudouridine38-40 synthase [Labrys monachus]